MAQGGATAIEDAAVLARCVTHDDTFETAFARFEALRKPRTARIQKISSANTWLRSQEGDTTWLYGYDAWTTPLAEAGPREAVRS